MATFRSWQSYAVFSHSIKRKARYILEKDAEDFLAAVLATSNSRRKEIKTGSVFWRAQLGHGRRTVRQDSEEYELREALPRDRMKPLRHAAREGRTNPKGLPYLYLATDRKTAMAEVRPWVGSFVSVGQFKTLRDLVLVDCSVEHGTAYFVYFEEPSDEQKETVVWADIDRSFSEPVNPDESTADYAPTQVLAELFRHNGFDGVVYKSLLGEGRNVTLFDIDTAELLNCFLYSVRSVSFRFNKVEDSYFVKKPAEPAEPRDV